MQGSFATLLIKTAVTFDLTTSYKYKYGLSTFQQGGGLSSSVKDTSLPRRHSWFVPAIFAAVLFIGGVASNLVANYVQPSLEPYRRWVWLSFGAAMIVTVIVAIRDHYRSSDSPPKGIGQEIARGWIDRVIIPLLRSLRGVEHLLTQEKVLTWRYQTQDFEMIYAARNLIHPLAKDSLEHFAEHYPDVRMMMSLYDQQREELSAACGRLQKALIDSEGLRVLYECAKADNSVVSGEAINSAFKSYTEMDHLETLAESIVNRRHKESYSYVYRYAWSKYWNVLLALRFLPDISAESERVDRAGEALLETVQSFILLLVATGKRLAERHDVSF